MGSLEGERRKLATESDGGEWCPIHVYGCSSLFSVTENISCKAISPREGGEERAELCHSGLTEVRGRGARLYMREGVGEVREGQLEEDGPLPGSIARPPL